ncbi:group III truncated hemoglobin [Francisellaceae bacterium]|nr:group III truncated hemoglobin [Francisellaceae bacterium]
MNISTNQIETFVGHFYDKINQDNLLGPIFNNIAQVDWDEHIPKLTRFWCSVLLKTGEYHGNAYQKHVLLSEKIHITELHFERWLKLFCEQAKLDFDQDEADEIMSKALNIAKSLKYGMLKQI